MTIYISLYLLRLASNSIELYPCSNGIILKKSGKELRVIRWNEIATIQTTIGRSPTNLFSIPRHLYIIRCHDGNVLTLSGVNKIASRWNKTLEKYFTRPRVPFRFADYQAGQTVVFGSLRFHLQGVTLREKTLMWEEIADISLLKGRHLLIQKAGEKVEIWARLPAFTIPDLIILLALFKRIRNGQSEQGTGAEIFKASEIPTVVMAGGRIDPLPEELASLAEEHGLGERRVDRGLGFRRIPGWPLFVFFVIWDTISIGGAIWLFSFLRDAFIGAEWPWPGIFMFIIRLLLLLFIILFTLGFTLSFLLQMRRSSMRATYTFERGLIFQDGKQAPVVCRWDRVVSVRQTSRLSWFIARMGFLFQQSDGSRFFLSFLDIIYTSLNSVIKENITPQQLPRAVAAYQNDQHLIFGPLQIDRQGITCKTSLLPWSQVKSVALEANHLVIYDITRRKPWCKLSVRRIPNLHLLFELADYARNLTSSAQESSLYS